MPEMRTRVHPKGRRLTPRAAAQQQVRKVLKRAELPEGDYSMKAVLDEMRLWAGPTYILESGQLWGIINKCRIK